MTQNRPVDMEAFKPPEDPIFQHLLSEAVIGAIPVYGVVISADRLVAFDPSHRPELTKTGREIVNTMMASWRNGRPPQPWVYPRDDQFVISDDYFTLAVVRAGNPATIACQCLGKVRDGFAISVEGPLPLTWVRQTLGLA